MLLFLQGISERRLIDVEGLMDARVDAKGKYFTKYVSKQSLAVVARVKDSIVHGTVHLAPDNRLKDELNGDETFLAFTNAEVYPLGAERPLYSTKVLVVNKDQIVWIFPCDAVKSEPDASI